jgi:GNAT superfamily N-acetyltransferase
MRLRVAIKERVSHACAVEFCATEQIRLRPEAEGDEPLLFALYSSTRAEELALTGWDDATCNSFLGMQFAAQRSGYRQMFPKASYDIVLLDNLPVGRMVVNRNADEIRVVDLVLAPEMRNRGIGTELLKRVAAESIAARTPLRLRVLRGNRALRFYERHGFAVTGETGAHLDMERTATLPL